MSNSRCAGVAAAGLALTVCGLHSSAAASGGIFDNCTSFNEKFPHGVGKKNSDLDRDKDKIACEKA